MGRSKILSEMDQLENYRQLQIFRVLEKFFNIVVSVIRNSLESAYEGFRHRFLLDLLKAVDEGASMLLVP